MLLLAAAGVGGYFLLKHFQSVGKQEAAAEITTALQDYEGAAHGLSVSTEPFVASDGSLVYESLDPTPMNPIPQFTAIVREKHESPYELWVENGKHGVLPLFKSSDRGKPYVDFNVKVPVGKIYFFNRDTGREVSAYELKKSPDWAPWLQDALENLFAHAFQDACKFSPRYNPWANWNATTGVNCAQKYPVTL